MEVLVDCGATHNFISMDLVHKLQLPTTRVKRYAISVRDDRRVCSDLQCPGVNIEIQGMSILQPFYPFMLVGVEVVLGVEWLATLGERRVNWGELYMKIREGEK